LDVGNADGDRIVQGARFRATRDLAVTGLSSWEAPFTGDFQTVIPAGTVLVADYGQVEGAEGFGVVPEDYAQLEPKLVPEGIRLADKYSGYYFVFLAAEVGDALQPLP
jgi:hypothetical protein